MSQAIVFGINNGKLNCTTYKSIINIRPKTAVNAKCEIPVIQPRENGSSRLIPGWPVINS